MSGAMEASPLQRAVLGVLFSTVVAVVYLPILVMIVFSFNSGRFQTMPFRRFITDWYGRAVFDQQYVDGLLNSLTLSGSVCLISTAIAFLCAYSLVNAEFPGKTLVTAFVLAPLAVPLVLIGISMRLYFVSLGLEPSLGLAAAGQVIYVMPLAILNLRNRIAQIPKSQEEAAWTLGASRLRSMLEILLPNCKLALIATGILTFTFAFDEFVIAYFLTNFSITLPIKIWTSLVTGFDPTINAVGTLVFLFSMALGLASQLLLMREAKR